MLNISTIIESATKNHPEKTALIFGDKKFSYSALNSAIDQIAFGLVESGIKKGDRIALTCPNLPYFPMVYYAILKTGATVVPLNVLLKKDEIAYHLKDSKAKAYFCFEGTPELPMGEQGLAGFKAVNEEKTGSCENFWLITADPAANSTFEGVETLGQLMTIKKSDSSSSGQHNLSFQSVATNPDDTAVILYTSGTTGMPKGAELSHSNIMMNVVVTDRLMRGQNEDVHLLTLPLFHSFGQVVQMNSGFYSGSTLALVPRFDPENVLQTMQAHNVTVFCGVPTMYWALLNFPDAENKFDLKKIADSLRLGVSGGAALSVEILKQFEEKFNIPILEGYGLSESSPLATFNSLDIERKPGSIGKAVWGVEVDVFDKNDQPVPTGEVGEIVIRGHNIMKGYLDRPEETTKAMRNGWFHSGDLAKKDEDGYLYIVDRLKDMVIRGGYNVYPREIEEVLLSHPGISLAAVIGVPHDEHGEEIKAFVIPKEGQGLTPEAVVEWSKEKMAAYKYPRLVEVRDGLPMTATGKILKRELQ